MLYFKNLQGVVFAYSSVSEKEKFGDPSLVLLSDEEVEVHVKANTVTPDFEVNSEKVWRDIELVRADTELNKVQDSDPKAVGTVAQWREYRKALRAWPEHKDFPNKEKRPVSPDA